MKYDNSGVRRQDRLLDESRAKALLVESEYGIMSMCGLDGKPYGIPVNYVWDGGDLIYVHCAPEGRKLEALAANGNVSLCVVGKVSLRPEAFTTGYESVVLAGRAEVVGSDEERWRALELLLRKLSPEHVETGLRYSERSFGRVSVIRMRVSQWSGKCKKVGG